MHACVTDNTNAIRFLISLFGLLLSGLNRYLMLYETILSELGHFLDALDNLSNNHLLHSVIHPKEMNVYTSDYTCERCLRNNLS